MQHLFNNKIFIEPSADAVVNLSASPAVAAMGSSTVLILGESARGSVDKVYEFTTVADARRVLHSGTGVDLCQICFAPSGQTAGASRVLFAKTNKSYPAVGKFAKMSHSGIQVTYKLEAQSGGHIYDYSGKIGFKMAVNGGAPVEYSAQAKYISGATASTCGVALAMKEILNQIKNVPGVKVADTLASLTTASNYVSIDICLDCPANTLSFSDPLLPSDGFTDSLGGFGSGSYTTEQTITGDDSDYSKVTVETLECGYNLPYAVKASNGVVTFMSIIGDTQNTLALLEGVQNAGALKEEVEKHPVLSTLFKVNLNGASEGEKFNTYGFTVPFYVTPDEATDINSFTNALVLSSPLEKSFVITDQTDEAYHMAMQRHVLSEADYPCDAYIGRELGVSPTEIMSYASSFNNESVVLAYPGIRLNLDGETKLYPASYFAAAAAGIAAGVQVQEPLTRKSVTALGFEDIDFGGNSAKTVREDLIDHGVLFGHYSDANGYHILKGINTIQNQNTRPMLGTDNRTHEISIARIRKQMAKELRNAADAVFPGTTKLHPNSTDVASFVASYLNSKVGTYLSSWDDKSLSVSLNDDAWYVEAGCKVNGPVNFAFFTLNLSL